MSWLGILRTVVFFFFFFLALLHVNHAPLVQLVQGGGKVGMRVVVGHLHEQGMRVGLILREAAALPVLRFLVDAVASGGERRVLPVSS
jgi:hypothetical protein